MKTTNQRLKTAIKSAESVLLEEKIANLPRNHGSNVNPMELVMDEKEKQFWIKHYSRLVGKTIKRVLVDPRAGVFGLELDTKESVWILCDEEGNGPGHLEIE